MHRKTKLSLPRCESSELALQPQKKEKVDKTKFKRPHTNSENVRDMLVKNPVDKVLPVGLNLRNKDSLRPHGKTKGSLKLLAGKKRPAGSPSLLLPANFCQGDIEWPGAAEDALDSHIIHTLEK